MEGELRFFVNFDSPHAVYTQIENQVLFAIASGKLKSGDRAPSGRDMATMLGINSNTVMKAYRDLELMGLVESRRGVGVMITAQAYKIALDKSMALVASHLEEAVAECIAVGMKPTDVKAMVAQYVLKGDHPYGRGR